jgi:hypothetical protein
MAGTPSTFLVCSPTHPPQAFHRDTPCNPLSSPARAERRATRTGASKNCRGCYSIRPLTLLRLGRRRNRLTAGLSSGQGQGSQCAGGVLGLWRRYAAAAAVPVLMRKELLQQPALHAPAFSFEALISNPC